LSRQQSTAPASALLLLLQKVNDIVRSKLIAELGMPVKADQTSARTLQAVASRTHLVMGVWR